MCYIVIRAIEYIRTIEYILQEVYFEKKAVHNLSLYHSTYRID